MLNGSRDIMQQQIQPWVEKYRPNTMSDVVSHQHIKDRLTEFVDRKKIPNMIFFGMSGTGKTSTILTFVKQIGCPYIELNGSDDRGIDVVRELIIDFCRGMSNTMKVIILDEVDAMTQEAQFALRNVIERFSKTCRFALICNYIHKIIEPLQSQCGAIFRFTPIDDDSHQKRIKYIASCEKMTIDDDAVRLLVDMAEGDMRKSINVLQSLPSHESISEASVCKALGILMKQEEDVVLSQLLDKTKSLKERIQFGMSYDPATLTNICLKRIMSNRQLCNSTLLDGLASIELALDDHANPQLQSAAIVSLLSKC